MKPPVPPTRMGQTLESERTPSIDVQIGSQPSFDTSVSIERPTFCPWCNEPAPSQGLCHACDRDVTDTRIGSVLDGRYRLDGLLGQGGMGRVYRATHLALGEAIAVKFLLAEWASRPEIRARFKREAVALAKLRHPGIVAVHDFGEQDGALYMVMELVRGISVIEELRRHGQRIELERAVAIIDQLLQVLEAAHSLGIVHRDLKPENVMVLASSGAPHALRIKVLDFGLALMDDQAGGARLTTAGTVRGTPLYMSPEQCTATNIGPPSDVYAVGTMLYEMLCGETPFAPNTPAIVMSQQVFTAPPRMSDRVPGFVPPPGLEALVMRALAKRADERPTATEFRALLERARRGEDAHSIRDAAARARAAAVGLSRDDRALGASAAAAHPTQPAAGAPAVGFAGTGEAPAVALVEGLGPSRAAFLRTALSVHGIDARGSLAAGETPALFLYGGGAAAAERVRALRAQPGFRRTPVLVLGVVGTEATAALIRAGASDVAPDDAADDVICQKVLRLLKRGR